MQTVLNWLCSFCDQARHPESLFHAQVTPKVRYIYICETKCFHAVYSHALSCVPNTCHISKNEQHIFGMNAKRA